MNTGVFPSRQEQQLCNYPHPCCADIIPSLFPWGGEQSPRTQERKLPALPLAHLGMLLILSGRNSCNFFISFILPSPFSAFLCLWEPRTAENTREGSGFGSEGRTRSQVSVLAGMKVLSQPCPSGASPLGPSEDTVFDLHSQAAENKAQNIWF